jgi:hypothetical protein
VDEERVEDTRLQEQFVAQVDDRSRPAQEILTDQQESRATENPPALYVP